MSWLTAVANFRWYGVCFPQGGFVVAINFLLQIRHVAVTDLNRVPVGDFMQRMALREFFVEDLQEGSSNVSSHFAVERGVVPNDVSVAVPSSRVRRLCRTNREHKFVVIPAVIESFLIKRRRFAKAIFIIEISDSLLLMDFGMFSMMRGGWLDFLLT